MAKKDPEIVPRHHLSIESHSKQNFLPVVLLKKSHDTQILLYPNKSVA